MSFWRVKQIALILGAAASFAAAFCLLIWAGLPNRADYSGQDFGAIGYAAPEIGAPAPPFQLQTLAGDELDLLDLRGEPVIINFWATWCVPCQVEMPELQALHEDTGVRILALNIGENPEIVTAWVQEYSLSFDILLDRDETVYALYRLRGLPSTYVLDADGIITAIFYGATNAAALTDALEQQENG
jgi:thiol-disulfide isomerase/thioredoxin